MSQSYVDWELIIINDSPEGGIQEKEMRDLEKCDQRIRVFHNQKNLGLSETLNRGIHISRAYYIARIDQDDLWIDSKKLEKQISFLDSHPDHALCGTNVELINMEGELLQKVYQQEEDSKIRNRMLMSTQFSHASVVFRRDVVLGIGGYRSEYNLMEDYDLWLRMGRQYKLHNIQDFCVAYRVNPKGMSLLNRAKQQKLALMLSCKYRHDYPGGIKGICVNLANICMPTFVIAWLNKLNRLTGKPFI